MATVSVAGSVVSISGVSAGFADVTVTATNAGGSNSQWFSVAVLAPPAPRPAIVLAPQATTAGAVVAFDLTPVFSGTVTSYSATSSDTAVLEASVDESIVVLRGAAAGSATATITATNDGTSTSQTVTVTVGAALPAIAAPQPVGALTAQEVAMGATVDVDVTGGFSGTVTGYIPVTADAAIVTAAPTTLGTVRLAGVAAGATTVRVVAVSAGGIAAQTLDVTVTEPPPLAISATAPTHCLTGEGTPTASGGRSGVATIDITYEVTNGTAPYTITNTATTDAPTTATGTLTVSCAQDGIDLTNIAPTANAVESGPKTITLTVTDTTDTTATTDVTIEIVEDAYTTEYEDGTMAAGSTYVIGDADAWRLLTVPAGLELRFAGVSQDVDHRFVDTPSGSSIVLRSSTGEELSRSVRATSTTTRSTRSTTRVVGALFDTLVASMQQPAGVTYTSSTADRNWHPYPLPPKETAAINLKLQRGGPLTEIEITDEHGVRSTQSVLLVVCNNIADPQTDKHGVPDDWEIDTHLRAAVDAWNAETANLATNSSA